MDPPREFQTTGSENTHHRQGARQPDDESPTQEPADIFENQLDYFLSRAAQRGPNANLFGPASYGIIQDSKQADSCEEQAEERECSADGGEQFFAQQRIAHERFERGDLADSRS